MVQSNSAKHDSIPIIRQQKVIIVRLLNQISTINNNGSNLIESFKYFNILLLELKRDNLSPKEYYELYIEVYDCLTILLNYLKSNHLKLFHLTDIYELVQYSNNLVPRLYLMITCGVAMLHIDDFPHVEILKDLIEMLNGVQHPAKGMFLRYYLLQRCKFIFQNEKNGEQIKDVKDNSVTTSFKVDFLIANFIEMNKLWIRLQYQGHFKDKLSKLKERKEVELLIGYNLVQITEVLDIEEEQEAIKLYKENTLPRILKQIISCRDIISQEYLLDIILQIFPESYHSDLQSVDLYLDSFLKLTPKTNISKNAVSLLSRILSHNENIKDDTSKPTKDLNGDIIFAKFLKFLKYLNEERPDLPFKEFLVIISELFKLVISLNANTETKLENINLLFKFMNFKMKDYNITEELSFLFKKIVLIIKDMQREDLYFEMALSCSEFTEFLINLNSDYLKYEILELIITTKLPDKNTISVKNLSKLLKLFDNNNFVVLQKPELILRCFYLIVNLKISTKDDNKTLINDQFEALQFCKNWILSKRAKFSKPEQYNKVDILINGLVNQYWKLLKKISILKKASAEAVAKLDKTLLQQLFKNLGNLIFELKNKKQLLSNLISSAELANQLSFFDIANDYLESVIQQLNSNVSTTDRYNSQLLLIEYLQKERKFYFKNGLQEKYEQFSIKLTVLSFDLPDVFLKSSCLLSCTHLWWTALSNETETNFLVENNGKRIYEIINKLIKYVTTNNLITNYQLCFVLLEVLSKVVYFFIYGELEYFTINYINNIFKLLKNNLRFLEKDNKLILEQQQENSMDQIEKDFDVENSFLDIDGSIKLFKGISNAVTGVEELNLNEETSLVSFKKNLLIFKNFENLKEYITDQGEVDERFNLLNL
mgnify:FL=1